MFKKKKSTPQIDKEQLEFLENAQKRIKQKKGLYTHFILFLIGSVFLIIANTVLGIGKEFTFLGKEWFLFAILIWFFILVYHTFNVFITHKFMGKDWEKKQLDKLMALQQNKIKKLREDLRQKENDIVKNKPTKQTITIIAATAENNAIGKDNKLIWHLSDDLKHFKNLTNGHHIIMGRKTFESFPKPLPNRTHIVITRQPNYKVPEGIIVVNNLEDALDAAKSDLEPYIIGGGEIYKQSLVIADKIELTRVHAHFEADTFFPEIDSEVWKETSNRKFNKDEKNEHDYSFITYERK